MSDHEKEQWSNRNELFPLTAAIGIGVIGREVDKD